MKRHRDALAIDGGACNPLPIGRAFQEALKEAMDELQDTDAVWNDAAILLMTNLICHLVGIGAEVGFARYGEAREECERRKEEV